MMAEAIEACEETMEGKGKAKGKCRDPSPSYKRNMTSALQHHHQVASYHSQEGFAEILVYKSISNYIAKTFRLPQSTTQSLELHSTLLHWHAGATSTTTLKISD
jgi:hypothetical protein